jgi:hypothetical protein
VNLNSNRREQKVLRRGTKTEIVVKETKRARKMTWLKSLVEKKQKLNSIHRCSKI